MSGKLIAIEGTDGSGKATQAALLVKKLQQAGKRAEKIEFPRYGQKSAYFVEEYLKGRYPADPYQAACFFAVDRYEASLGLIEALKEDVTIITDRYTLSSMAHLGGRIKDIDKRKEFYAWLYDLEFKYLKVPKPNISLLLHVPAETALATTESREPKLDLGELERDVHEADLQHMKAAENAYLEISELYAGQIKRLECTEDGKQLSVEVINQKIIELLAIKI